MSSENRQPDVVEKRRGGAIGRVWRSIPTFTSLSIPAYRTYFWAMFLFFASMQMTTLARPWLAFELSADADGNRSAIVWAFTVAVNSVPSMVLAPYAGALADKVSKRNILIGAGVLMALLAAITAAGMFSGAMQWWHVTIIGLGQGAVMSFVTPTRRAIVAELVDSEHLLNATALHTFSQNLNRTIMPLTAGGLIAAWGAEWAFSAIAGFYGLAILALLAVPLTVPVRSRRPRGMNGAVREGFKYAVHEPVIRNLLLIGFVGSIFGQPVQHIMPLFQDVLGIGPGKLGVLFTTFGVGSLLGSTTAASVGNYKHKGWLLIGFFTLLGFSIVAFAASSIYLLSVFLMIPVGMGHSGRTAVHIATLQGATDPEMRGRVNAINTMTSGPMTVSIMVIGVVADAYGPQIALGGAGSIVLLYGLWEMIFAKTIRRLE